MLAAPRSVILWRRLGWVVPLGGLVFLVGQALAGALVVRLGLAPPHFTLPASPAELAAGQLAAGMIITLGAALVARYLAGGPAVRGLVLWGFLYVVNGLNVALEAAIFTTLGGAAFMAVHPLLPSLLMAAFLATLVPVRPNAPGFGELFARWATARSASAWMLQLLLALAAFPAIYFFFGVFAGMIVREHYDRADGFLIIPSLRIVAAMQVLRSGLFLIASLPIIAGWCGSRAKLIVCLGLAHFCLVGLAGLITPGMFPMLLRVAHGAEIFADSMVYAWALVALLSIPQTAAREQLPLQPLAA